MVVVKRRSKPKRKAKVRVVYAESSESESDSDSDYVKEQSALLAHTQSASRRPELWNPVLSK